jgi:diguanylate cyclase (GGDEF)-like protein/PAS domain S-box-containing protein
MQPKLTGFFSRASTAYVVLSVGLLLSFAATYLASRHVENEARLKFEGTVSDWPDAIEARIRAYADILLGIRGLYFAGDAVSRAEFHGYVKSLDLHRRYPGVQVIHYGERITAAQRPAFEQEVRTDTSIDPHGYPDFTIKPPGERAEYVVVRYVEPMPGNEAALGLDLSGDAVRLAALERTRDSGLLTASGTIALANDPKRHPGFAMRLPVYRPGMPTATTAQRREAFTGVISASFVIIDLMRGLFGEPNLERVRILIHDAGYVDSQIGPEPPSLANRMFDSDRLLSGGRIANSYGLASSASIEVGGRRWNISFTAREPFVDPSTRWLPAMALFGGLAITLLLFGLTRSLATSGSRAIELANRITADLRTSQANLAEAQRMTQQLIEVLPNPVFFKDTDGRYIGVNKAWERYFGISRDQFIGKSVFELYPENRAVAERLDAMDQVLWRSPGSQTYETTITTPDGRRHETIYYKATFSRSDGSVAGLIGTIVDITERKEAEARYRATFESAPVGIMHTAIDDDRILHANPKLCAMLGYTESELLAMTTDQTLAPQQRGADRPVYREKMLNGELGSYSSERKYLRKDGSSLWVNRTVALARDANGTPLYFIRIVEDISERKAATERYQSTFDNAPVGIMHVSLERSILHVNPKLCQILGYEEQELIGKAVDEVIRPELRNTDRHSYSADMLSGKIQSYSSERVYVRKDGSPVPINRTISLVRDAEGQPLYFVRVIEDISERKELERRFRETFDQAAVGIVHTSYDGKYLQVNQRFCEMLGYTESELIGREAASFTHPDDRERGRQARQLMWEGKLRNFIEEKRYLRKDGSVIWTNRTVSLARDASGSPMYFIRVIEDITERKEIEERYRATFDNAPVGIMHTEVNTYRILSANRKLAEMLGYTQEELLAMTSTAVLHPEDRFTDRSKYLEPMRDNAMQSYASERRFVRKDGSVLWVNRTVSLVKDAAGNPLYFIRIVEDISERKQAERRQAMEHAITRVLADAPTLAEAIPRVIQTICETMGWHCGARWQMDKEAGLLCCRETWGIDTPEIGAFVDSIRERKVAPTPVGQGLVRRTFAAGKPVWITDIAQDEAFKRREYAEKADLHGAFGFPLLGSNEVLGVMEFFHRDVREPDEMLIQITQSIGSQIGQYMVRMQAEEAVKFVATHDSLTGLPNRVMFNQRLGHAIAQARRYARRLAVLFIDLDRFKIINDTLGHESGDVLLREVAARLTANLRSADTVARLGGDEFVVLVEEAGDEHALAGVAQKLITALTAGFPLHGQEYHVTASIGVSTFPDDGEDVQTLLKNADIAMYRAKEHGRNAYRFYSAQMNVHSMERLTLESSLRRAIERREFTLHYQPQVHMRRGQITGMEALVRWQHPELGLVPPDRFIQIAEETGLIVPMGEWVLHTACEAQRAWEGLGILDVTVAVNLSARQFVHGDLAREVMRALERTGCPARRLELEITESMVMQSPERAVEVLNQLQEMGVGVAIDDFGIGYSSLAYLKRFPIDSLKIDRSFIMDIPGDKNDAAITQAVIAMAHSLGIKVIAEGVETRQQYNFLRKHRCDEMQGYYFSPPLPIEQATGLLLQQRQVSNA